MLEAYREVLQEHFDLPALQEILADIAARRIRVTAVSPAGPSPFASSLSLDFVASFLYEYDAPPAERRAAALTIDHTLLRDLLGEPELRELLDPEAIAGVELELQHLAPGHLVSGADGVADLLRRLGPLTGRGVAARCADDHPASLLEGLRSAGRAVEVRLAGEPHWAAVEDAARLRDALGVALPSGVPETFLAPVSDPLGDVVGRYARTHGPFTTAAAAAALGLPAAAVSDTLARLEGRGRLGRGAFLPHGQGREWVDTEVLRRLRRRSVARLRRQVEAVDPAAYAGFCAGWHGIGDGAASPEALLEAVGRLQGAAVPASVLEGEVLSSRLDYRPALLDALAAAGDIVWLGRGALGAGDGRVALYLRSRVGALHWPLGLPAPDGEAHQRLRAHLEERGASFFPDLYAAAGGGDPQAVLEALWDLVWAGEVTNDTPAPLRSRVRGKAPRAAGRAPVPSATPPAGIGRWYLVRDLTAAAPSPTAAAAARAEQLLARHGVLGREAVRAEGLPGGFSSLYPVLSALEEAGRVRRGYFVEGLGGAQFALPGALDRLRAGEASGLVTLAAADPASPYGAALPWPDHPAGQPSRSAGAYVLLADGRLAAFVERGGRRLLTFLDDPGALGAVAGALAALARRVRRLSPATVDGRQVEATPLGVALAGAGFVPSYRGMVLRRP